MKCLLKGATAAALCVVGIAFFASCDGIAAPPLVEDNVVMGEYEGTMTYFFEEEEPSAPEAVKFSVVGTTRRSGDIVFSDFPVKGIVTAVAGTDLADEIVTKLGKVSYLVSYAEDPMNIAGRPIICSNKDLTLNMPGVGKVKAFISRHEYGFYAEATKNLKFVLYVRQVTLNGAEYNDFRRVYLSFDATKK